MARLGRRARGYGAAGASLLIVAVMIGCGSSSMGGGPPVIDPVAMALMAPGVRTVIVPKQRSAITIVVPPCSNVGLRGKNRQNPPGSNSIVLPKGTAAQTVAIQPCVVGQPAESTRAGTVLLTPGGGITAQSQSQQQTAAQTQNQLVIPANSDLQRVIVPPCLVVTDMGTSSGGFGNAGPNTLAIPARGGKRTIIAPPCQVSASTSSTSSSSSSSSSTGGSSSSSSSSG